MSDAIEAEADGREGEGSRFSVPRGLIAGTLAASALVWGQYAVIPGSSLLSAQVQSGIYGRSCSHLQPPRQVLLARTFQRYTLTP